MQFGVEGYTRNLLPDEERVVHAGAGLLDPPPCPARDGEDGGHADSQKRGLPGLARSHPEIAPESDQGGDAEDGHCGHVGLVMSHLVRVSGVAGLLNGSLVGFFEMGLRPVRAEGAEHQSRHDSLTLVQVGQRAEQGDEGVRAGVEQVVVAEGAQGDVIGAAGAEGHRPRPLALFKAQRVVLRRHLVDARLGIVGRYLAAHDLLVEAAGHECHAVYVPGQFQGKWLRHGDGLEHVLDAEQGSFPRAGRRHRHKHGAVGLRVSEQYFSGVEFHGALPFRYWVTLDYLPFSCGCPAATR